jgi:hypothetical protein
LLRLPTGRGSRRRLPGLLLRSRTGRGLCQHLPGPTPAALYRNPHLSDRISTYSAIMLTIRLTRGRRLLYIAAAPLLPTPSGPGPGCVTSPAPSLFTHPPSGVFSEVRIAPVRYLPSGRGLFFHHLHAAPLDPVNRVAQGRCGFFHQLNSVLLH